jgi:hypothetical protein
MGATPTNGDPVMGLQFPGPIVRVCPSLSQSERVTVFLGQSDDSDLRLGQGLSANHIAQKNISQSKSFIIIIHSVPFHHEKGRACRYSG